MTSKANRLSTKLTVISIVAIIITSAIIGYFHRYLAINDLITQGQKNNVILTRITANLVLPEINSLKKTFTPHIDDYINIENKIASIVKDTPVLKLKTYDLERRVLYSTNRKEIGNIKKKGYDVDVTLETGKVVSTLSYRKRFQALQGDRDKIYVLSSYIPIYNNEHDITGAFEIYSDVSNAYEQISVSQTIFFVSVLITLILTSLVLYFFIKLTENKV